MNKIVNFFKNEIECVVNCEEFCFKSYKKEIKLKTFINITREKNPKIISVGIDIDSYQKLFDKIFLFKPTKNNPNFQKIDCLSLYFRYAFKLVSNNRLTKPIVTFKNSSSLNSFLSGYEKDILKQAVLLAGCVKCEFK